MAKYQTKADTVGCVGYALQDDDYNMFVKIYGTLTIMCI